MERIVLVLSPLGLFSHLSFVSGEGVALPLPPPVAPSVHPRLLRSAPRLRRRTRMDSSGLSPLDCSRNCCCRRRADKAHEANADCGRRDGGRSHRVDGDADHQLGEHHELGDTPLSAHRRDHDGEHKLRNDHR